MHLVSEIKEQLSSAHPNHFSPREGVILSRARESSLEPDLLLYTVLRSGKLSSESLTKFKICSEQIEWENILSTYIAAF